MMQISIASHPTFKRYGADEGFALIRKAGFTSVDWTISVCGKQSAWETGDYEKADCVFARSDEEIDAYFQPQWDAIQKSGLTVGPSPF